MRPLQRSKHPLRHVSSSVAHARGITLAAQEGVDQTPSRHDEQLLGARIVPRDPYAVWLAQRESERSREHRPAHWVMRQRGVCGSGAGR